MTYEPEYLDPTESIDNLVQSIHNAIEYWLMCHTDAETWASNWSLDGSYSDLMSESPVLENNYFSFNLQEAALWHYADSMANAFNKCSECGMISEYSDCGCEDSDSEEVSTDELCEWLEEVGSNSIPEDMIERAMIDDGFEVYSQALGGTIASVVEECETALQMFKDASTGTDLLNAAMSASSILHINGDILDDYGQNVGLDYNTVDTYRTEGLKGLFEREEILEFMNS